MKKTRVSLKAQGARALLIIVISLGAALLLHTIYYKAIGISDADVRKRVYKIQSNTGNCTGVQVRAASGKVVMLTAAHCFGLFSRIVPGGRITATAIAENGTKTVIEYVDRDDYLDLMIMTKVNDDFVFLANNVKLHQRIHSTGHGLGLPLFSTEGELVTTTTCQFMPMPDCIMLGPLMLGTALVLPGGSGGPLLNNQNELIGITVRYQMPLFSLSVPIDVVRNFLKKY